MSALAQTSLRSTLWGVLRLACSGWPPSTRMVWQDDQLTGLKQGQLELQEAFVAHFWPQIAEDARRYGRLGGQVDDLQGEGALALWESVFAYQPWRHRTTFTDYAKNTVHQRIRREYLKQRNRDERLNESSLKHASGRDENFTEAECFLDFAHALQSLSPEERLALTWCPLPTMSRKEYERSRKRLQRARQRLKRQLQQMA